MSSPLDRQKAAAARAAVEEVHPGELLALGTGTTAAFVVRELARRFPDGADLDCVASSTATEALASSLGLRVRPLRPEDHFELMIDGADEVSDALDLTKGGGGALFREKLLARRSRHVVIVVDSTKLVPLLGTRAPIPVEVVPFARRLIAAQLELEGLGVQLRTSPGPDGPMKTDNGLEILDVRPPEPIRDPGALDDRLHRIPGVVETGLFLGLAERVYVGGASGGVERRIRRTPT